MLVKYTIDEFSTLTKRVRRIFASLANQDLREQTYGIMRTETYNYMVRLRLIAFVLSKYDPDEEDNYLIEDEIVCLITKALSYEFRVKSLLKCDTDMTSSTTSPIGQLVDVYIGISDTPTPDLSTILGFTKISVPVGSDIVGDYRANSVPKFLIMAMGIAHPLRTSWYGSPASFGTFGPGETFRLPYLSTDTLLQVYATTFPTQQTDHPIIFRL